MSPWSHVLLLLLLLSISVKDKGHTKGEACKHAPQGYKHTYTKDNYAYNIHTVDKINYRTNQEKSVQNKADITAK